MTYSTQNTKNGLGFWKVLGVIAVALIALIIIGPLLKGLFWLALFALAIYGGYMLFRSSRSRNHTNGSV